MFSSIFQDELILATINMICLSFLVGWISGNIIEKTYCKNKKELKRTLIISSAVIVIFVVFIFYQQPWNQQNKYHLWEIWEKIREHNKNS
jgi:hypothetical protein